jgi:hypothetical protein
VCVVVVILIFRSFFLRFLFDIKSYQASAKLTQNNLKIIQRDDQCALSLLYIQSKFFITVFLQCETIEVKYTEKNTYIFWYDWTQKIV